MRRMQPWPLSSARWWSGRWSMPALSCRASRICRPRSRSRSGTISWPMSRWRRATAAALPTRASDSMNRRSALRRWPGHRSPSIATRRQRRGASTGRWPTSRFGEEIVIWPPPLVGLVRLSGKFTSGSSIMPQKRNPDAAELVRAKTGRVIGALTALLIVMKGLPLAYQKDMQEDKQGAMEAFGALSLAIRAMTGMVADIVPDEARMKAAAGEGYATATDLADWLVRTLKMPFRDAHHVTGRIVAKASKAGVPLHQLPLTDMQAIEPKITADVMGVLSVEASVKSRISYGGTAPKNVLAQAKAWRKRLQKERKLG